MGIPFWLPLLLVQYHGFLNPAAGSSSYTTAGMGRAEVPEPEWSYSNLAAWPSTCQTGKQQSPISFRNITTSDIRCSRPPEPLDLSEGCTFKAESTSLQIDNGVNTVRVTFVPRGKAGRGQSAACTLRDPSGAVGNDQYRLVAMHFHAPPEHLFPNATPDAELHIVFKAEEEKSEEPAVVVAVQLVVSDAVDTSATRIFNHIMVEGPLPPRQATTTCTLETDLTIAGMLPRRRSYVTYRGSLTTPPCTEGIRFVIMTTPQFISKLAFSKLLEALRQSWPENRLGNRRPTQSLNGRKLCRYIDDRGVKPSARDGMLDDYFDAGVGSVGEAGGSTDATGVKGGSEVNSSRVGAATNQTEEQTGEKQLWPHALKPHEAVLFSAAAVILVVAAIILYWWSNNANERVNAEEVVWLGGGSEVYGTSSP